MWPRALLQCGVTSNTSYPHHLLSPRAGSVPLPSAKFSCWLRKWERICEMRSGPEPNRAFPNLIRAPHSKIRLISKKNPPCKSKHFPHQDQQMFFLSHLDPQRSPSQEHPAELENPQCLEYFTLLETQFCAVTHWYNGSPRRALGNDLELQNF